MMKMTDEKERTFMISGKLPPVSGIIRFQPLFTTLVFEQNGVVYNMQYSTFIFNMTGDEIINMVKSSVLALGDQTGYLIYENIQLDFIVYDDEFEEQLVAYKYYNNETIEFKLSICDGRIEIELCNATSLDVDQSFVETISDFIFEKLSAMKKYKYINHYGSKIVFIDKLFKTPVPELNNRVYSYKTVIFSILKQLKKIYTNVSYTGLNVEEKNFHQKIDIYAYIPDLAHIQISNPINGKFMFDMVNNGYLTSKEKIHMQRCLKNLDM